MLEQGLIPMIQLLPMEHLRREAPKMKHRLTIVKLLKHLHWIKDQQGSHMYPIKFLQVLKQFKVMNNIPEQKTEVT